MHCPYCGKQTPNNSTFCLHCGKKMPKSGGRATAKWENKDFVYAYAPGRRPYRGAQSLVYTRRNIWEEEQQNILPELQKWIDLGWESITEIGPAGFEWETFKQIELVALIPSTFTYERAIAFRVKMRAPKGTKTPPPVADQMSILMKKVEKLVLKETDRFYYQKGLALMKLKRFDDARLEFAKAMKVSGGKNDKWYKAALVRLAEIGL